METNFGKGKMKVFIKDTFEVYIVSSNNSWIYWVGKNPSKYLNIKFNFLWLSEINYSKKIIIINNLKYFGINSYQFIRWNNQIDNLYVHIHIARNHHEASIKEKMKKR